MNVLMLLERLACGCHIRMRLLTPICVRYRPVSTASVLLAAYVALAGYSNSSADAASRSPRGVWVWYRPRASLESALLYMIA